MFVIQRGWEPVTVRALCELPTPCVFTVKVFVSIQDNKTTVQWLTAVFAIIGTQEYRIASTGNARCVYIKDILLCWMESNMTYTAGASLIHYVYIYQQWSYLLSLNANHFVYKVGGYIVHSTSSTSKIRTSMSKNR